MLVSNLFGTLEWDDQIGRWLGECDWNRDLRVELAIEPRDVKDPSNLQSANEGYAWLRSNETDATARIRSAALQLYNTAWCVNQTPMSDDEFRHHLELMRIAFNGDGSILLTHDAGELFGGHVVDAILDPNRRFVGIELVG